MQVGAARALASQVLSLIPPCILEFDGLGVVNVLHALTRLRLHNHHSQHNRQQQQQRSPQRQRGGGGLGEAGVLTLFGSRRQTGDNNCGSGDSDVSLEASLFASPSAPSSLSSAVVEDLLYVSMQYLPDLEPRAFSSLVYSVARLGLRPDRPWLAAFLRHSLPLLPSFGSQSLANTAWALAHMGLHPEREWLGAFYRQCEAEMGAFSTQVGCWG